MKWCLATLTRISCHRDKAWKKKFGVCVCGRKQKPLIFIVISYKHTRADKLHPVRNSNRTQSRVVPDLVLLLPATSSHGCCWGDYLIHNLSHPLFTKSAAMAYTKTICLLQYFDLRLLVADDSSVFRQSWFLIPHALLSKWVILMWMTLPMMFTFCQVV